MKPADSPAQNFTRIGPRELIIDHRPICLLRCFHYTKGFEYTESFGRNGRILHIHVNKVKKARSHLV